jgi:4-amino-4-deoxy-L-arabinose transferase-like glycosyltransferase
MSIFLTALLVRGLMLILCLHDGIKFLIRSDPYLQTAEFLAGMNTQISDYVRWFGAPVFSFFCAAVLKLTGGNTSAIITLNVLLSSVTCVLTAKLGDRLYRGIGHLGGYLLVFSFGAVFFSAHLQSESLFVFLEVALFLWLYARWDVMGSAEMMGLGFLGGITNLTRTVFGFYLPVLFLVMITVNPWKKIKFRRITMLVAGWILSVGAWMLFAFHVTGRFVPISATGGQTFYIGTLRDPNTMTEEGERVIKELEQSGIHNWFDKDKAFRRIAVRYVREHPKEYACTLMIKIAEFWRPWPYPPYPMFIRVAVGAWYTVLFLFGSIGIYVSRKRWNIWMPLYALIVCLTAVHAVMATSLRYRIPLEPILCLLAAVGLKEVFQTET